MTDSVLAMHMGNELLSVPVAAATIVLAAVCVGAAARAARRRIGARALSLMGVMGAFVFAAQMINFPVLPGVSGHLCGGVLLAILLGPQAAVVVVTAILIVQCLLFQDGGILALGCNVLNMGVVQCVLGWIIYRAILGRGEQVGGARQYLAAWAACVAAVAGGACLVPLQAGLSGVLQIPWPKFLGAMLGIHLLIGFVEGLITFAVLAYVRRVRPEVLGIEAPGPGAAAPTGAPVRAGAGALAVSILATALALAGVGSWLASSSPDGLEASLVQSDGSQIVKESDSPAIAAADALQARYAPLPDYSGRTAPIGATAPATESESDASWPNISGWTSLAGIVGTLVTLGLVYILAAVLRSPKQA